jgi:hypothetical protein
MQDIEPFFRWRDYYTAEEDEHSPFFGRQYSELHYVDKIYNYYIHPQWDNIGSPTLYTKLLYVDYDEKYALIELMGEWNDCITNDIMYLKRDIADVLINKGITKFVLFCENILNFHASDDCYYEEWWDDVKEEDGWIAVVNSFDHVTNEMKKARLHYYINFGIQFNDLNWQNKSPENAFNLVQQRLNLGMKALE